MRKIITTILTILVLTVSVNAQKKETKTAIPDSIKASADTAYVISKPVKQIIELLLRQNMQSFNGKALSFDDILQLIQQLNQAPIELPKQQQKEPPKK